MLDQTGVVRGDLDKGFKEADSVIEGTYAYDGITQTRCHWNRPSYFGDGIAIRNGDLICGHQGPLLTHC